MKASKFNQKSSGITFVEMMIATALLAIVCLGSVAAFGNIAKAVQFSKSRTIASNLAQEQMQILKQKSFNQVLITTAAAHDSHFDDDVPYDNGYYPPETITEGGLTFTRYTFVQVADEDSGNLNYPGSFSDTGMKAIQVTVIWSQGSDYKKVELRNILANISTTMSNSIFNGNMRISGAGTAIQGGRVTVAENVGYEDTTNSVGNYSINVFPGNYTLVATADGYFPMTKTASVGGNTVASNNFDMIAMGSGTVRGTAWINDHLVVSQVVASTVNVATGFNQEYVEVFNPSTWTWTIASDPTTPVINLLYQRHSDSSPTAIPMGYNNLTVGPSFYYLFANTSPVVVAGISKIADAVFLGSPDLILDVGSGGDADALGLAFVGASNPIDVIGWTYGAHQPRRYEGNASTLTQSGGFLAGEQYVRRSSTSGVIVGLGRAYDSGSNDNDFLVFNPISFPPKNSANFDTIVAGVPAVGAYVSATDGLSSVTNAYQAGSPPYAEFQLTSVATGTWTVFITSGAGVLAVSTVTVTPNTTTFIPNSLTSPTWPVANFYSSILSITATSGYVTGSVKDVLLNAITPAINVTAGGTTGQANTTNGNYFLQLTPGTYDVVANPNNQNGFYVYQTSQSVEVDLGVVSSGVDFVLSQGGRFRGNSTRDGTNPLPGISFIATDVNSVDQGPAISGADGQFTLVNLATGVYTVAPVLGSGETSVPSSVVSTITAGSTVSVGTFTITGSYGTVRGNVTVNSGQSIRTGVLIVASTATITTPPALSQASLTGAAYYITNSYEDGSYSLDIRGSTVPYNVYGYYTTYNVSTPSTTVRNALNINVTAGVTTSGVNFAW